jgi:hypothetical protein
LNSFKNFDECFQFCSKIFNEIIEFLDPLNSSPTRQQSANCLLEMSEKLHQLWSKERLVKNIKLKIEINLFLVRIQQIH